ncbi:polyprenyl synthetase family protein [Calditrichota bacterium]
MIRNSKYSFIEELKLRSKIIHSYVLEDRFLSRFQPQDVRSAVSAYIRYGGKRLRPAILLFSCGAVGGDEEQALPAAAAVEIFHTWTLVHDDIIDRDDLRRGSPTVHELYRMNSQDPNGEFKLTPDEAKHYGTSIAILTGDIQHGWGISMMAELTTKRHVDPNITLNLINELDTKVLNTLVEGEVLDIQYAFSDIAMLKPDEIEDMLWKKTGALYEFCGRAGAMIGLNTSEHPYINAVAEFAALCGTAFQLQDDILGVTGDVITLGKPIGSDLREGKRTLVVYHAYHNADEKDRRRMMSTLGNAQASDEEIQATIKLLRDLGGVDLVKERAKQLISKAQPLLEILPASKSRDLLSEWADYLINREL